jgi:hypothetical protein
MYTLCVTRFKAFSSLFQTDRRRERTNAIALDTASQTPYFSMQCNLIYGRKKWTKNMTKFCFISVA